MEKRKIYKYIYKGKEYRSFLVLRHENIQDLGKIKFPPIKDLTDEILNKYGITRVEVVPPTPTPEMLQARMRRMRDALINRIEWRVDRYRDQKEVGAETSDSELEYHKVLSYMQYLRDYPASGEEWWKEPPLTYQAWRERSNQ